MFQDSYPGPCIYPPYEQCDLCGTCAEWYCEFEKKCHENDESSNEDIEQYFEEQCN